MNALKPEDDLKEFQPVAPFDVPDDKKKWRFLCHLPDSTQLYETDDCQAIVSAGKVIKTRNRKSTVQAA
jgi:hypothetical protein